MAGPNTPAKRTFVSPQADVVDCRIGMPQGYTEMTSGNIQPLVLDRQLTLMIWCNKIDDFMLT